MSFFSEGNPRDFTSIFTILGTNRRSQEKFEGKKVSIFHSCSKELCRKTIAMLSELPGPQLVSLFVLSPNETLSREVSKEESEASSFNNFF